MYKTLTIILSLFLLSPMQDLLAQNFKDKANIKVQESRAVTGPMAPEILPVIGVLVDYDARAIKDDDAVGPRPITSSNNNEDFESGRISTGEFQAIYEEQDEGKNELPNTALNTLQLYPVPVVNELNVEIDIHADLLIQLYDVLGRLLVELNPRNVRQHSIDLGAYGNGIYLLRVKAGNEVVTRKFEVYR